MSRAALPELDVEVARDGADVEVSQPLPGMSRRLEDEVHARRAQPLDRKMTIRLRPLEVDARTRPDFDASLGDRRPVGLVNESGQRHCVARKRAIDHACLTRLED